MRRFFVICIAAAFAAVLGGAMLDLPLGAIDLRTPVAANLGESGVSHPVTAVLLNYRGYDTLLEIAVLLLALLGILAVVGKDNPSPPRPAHPVLQTLARLATPSIIVMAVYLLWAGAFAAPFRPEHYSLPLPCCCIWLVCCRAGARPGSGYASASSLASWCF